MSQHLHPFSVTLTQRGFARVKFFDLYGLPCSLQASSLSTESCIWLGADRNDAGEPNDRMHLSREMVQRMLPHLTAFAETGIFPVQTENLRKDVSEDGKPLSARHEQSKNTGDRS